MKHEAYTLAMAAKHTVFAAQDAAAELPDGLLRDEVVKLLGLCRGQLEAIDRAFEGEKFAAAIKQRDDEDEAKSKRRLCAHADQNGKGMHWLEPGEMCNH